MTTRERDGLFIFHSIHRVMKAEKALKEAGVDVRLLPVPRQLSSDCGLSIAFPWSERERAEAQLTRAAVSPAEVYRLLEGRYQRTPDREPGP